VAVVVGVEVVVAMVEEDMVEEDVVEEDMGAVHLVAVATAGAAVLVGGATALVVEAEHDPHCHHNQCVGFAVLT